MDDTVEGEANIKDENDNADDEEDGEDGPLSKKKMKQINRLSVAELKQLVDKPDVVEVSYPLYRGTLFVMDTDVLDIIVVGYFCIRSKTPSSLESIPKYGTCSNSLESKAKISARQTRYRETTLGASW